MKQSHINIIVIFGLLLISPLGYAQEALKIMPLGNSITYDSNVADEDYPRYAGDRIAYRYKLYQLLNEEGYTFDFVGNRNAGFFHFPDGENAGFPGIEPSGLLQLIKTGYNNFEDKNEILPPQNYLAKYKPDIILLHIGTNGLHSGNTENYKNEVNEILNEVDAIETMYAMDIPVFLAKIINRSPYHSPTHTYNSKLGQLAASRSGDIIKVVDMEGTGIDGIGIDYRLEEEGGDMADTWHPNNSGYEKMALEWFEALEQYNFKPPVITSIPNQTIREHENFDTIFLDNYVFDPQERDEEIAWHVVSTDFNHLEYQILSGRKLIVTVKDEQWNGTESIILRASDPVKGGQKYYTDQVEVSFTVDFVNDTATIISQTPVTIYEDNSYVIKLDDLFVEDADNEYPNDFSLHIEPGQNYTVDGFNIIPDINFNGQLSIPVRVNDGNVFSDVFDFIIQVEEINDHPTITGQKNVSGFEDIHFTLTLSDLLVDDVDNNYPLDFTIMIAAGENYSVMNDTIWPANNYHGQLNIPVIVFDGSDSSNLFIVTAEIISVNDKPVLSIPRTVFQEDSAVSEYLTTFDLDGDKQISVLLVERPSWLFYARAEMRLYGTPKYENVGEHEITFRISDGKESYDTTFTLEVVHINDPPVIQSTANDLEMNKNDILKLTLDDLVVTDSDNTYPDDFRLTLLSGDHYVVMDIDSCIIKPEKDYVGMLKVKTVVNDGIDNSNVKEIDVNVKFTDNLHDVNLNEFAVNLYPNPVSDYLNVQTEIPFVKIELFTVLGKLRFSTNGLNETSNHQINVTNCPSGVYIVKVFFENGDTAIRKSLIKR